MALRGDNKVVAEEWERVKELFETALECVPPERAALLSRLAQEEPLLAEQISRLLASHEQAGDFLHLPLIFPADFLDDLEEPQRFSPDEVLCNRFKIIRLIGKGGMGEVYEAWDQELEERVALKTLRSEVSTNEVFTARFRREIQLARKVTHPNVCRIFESLRHQTGNETISVLSMELLQGQTLGEYLKTKGRLSADEALPLARQIIDGLSAVHAAGIIHRDLKPPNLVLVPEGDGFRVKITDFGIAGRLPENPSQPALTQASKMLGTPDYMAPEQLEHGRATIQSDIYALGLVLYEMVTGVKPFAETGAWKRLYEDSRPPKKLVPELPEHWNKSIVCCLERTPQYRFSSAEAVAQSLTEDAPPALIPTKPLPLRLKAAARKGRWAMLAFLVISMALVIAAVRYFRQNPEIPPGTTVLVTDIATSDPAFSGITVAMKSQLAQSAHFEVEEDSKIVEVLKQMNRKPDGPMDAQTARQVALRSGVPLVIYGSLNFTSEHSILRIKVERVKYTPLFASQTWKREFPGDGSTGMLTSVHEASSWIRTLVGESPSDLAHQDRPVEDTTTSSWEALKLLQSANDKASSGDTGAAIVLLEEATRSDPRFALAHMRLADLLLTVKRDSEGYEEWQRAIDLTEKTELTSRESLRIKGQFYDDAGNYPAAEEIFHEYTIHYPSDFLAWFYWASALDNLDRKDEAVEAFKRAVALRPNSVSGLVHLAELYLSLGKLQDALLLTEELKRIPAVEWSEWLSSYSSFLAGDYDEALRHASVLSQSNSPEWQSRAYSLKSMLLAEMGKRQESTSTLEEGISFDLSRGFSVNASDKYVGIAYLSYKSGDREACKTNALRAASLDESAHVLVTSGTLLARIGEVKLAADVLQNLLHLRPIPRTEAAINRLRGEIALARGETRKAVEFFELAAKASPAEYREYLGRALVRRDAKQSAEAIWATGAANPARILLRPGDRWPGAWGDSLFEILMSMEPGPRLCHPAQRFMQLRGRADPSVLAHEVRGVRAKYSLSCSNLIN